MKKILVQFCLQKLFSRVKFGMCPKNQIHHYTYIYRVLYNEITVLADNNCCLVFDTIAKKEPFFFIQLDISSELLQA